MLQNKCNERINHLKNKYMINSSERWKRSMINEWIKKFCVYI